MAVSWTTLSVFVYAVILFFGGSVTYFTYRAYRRTGTRAMGVLCLGISLITVALLTQGGLYGAIYDGPGVVSFVPALIGATGFGLLLYSLYTRQDKTGADETT